MQVSVWSSECSSREKSVGGPGRRAEEQRGEMRVRELLLNTTTKHWARTRFTSEKTICISLRGSAASSALPIDIDELQLGTSPAHHSLQQRKVRHTHTHTQLCGWQPDSKESHFHVQETTSSFHQSEFHTKHGTTVWKGCFCWHCSQWFTQWMCKVSFC